MKRITTVLACLVVAAAVLVWLGLKPGASQPNHRPGRGARAVPVLTAKAKSEDVPVRLEGVGTVQAWQTVTVRAQVSGQLLSVDFKEGQHVDKGDVLAKIDPRTYRAQLEQAKAQLAQDRAALANARTELKRNARLAKKNYVSKEKADQSRATVRQDEARIKNDKAAIDDARVTLGYTKITAPLSGRTGIRQVDAGNIVSPSDTGGIVVITQLQPIAVVFTLPAADIQRVNAASAQHTLPVTVLDQNDEKVLNAGHLIVIGNQVDPGTGTIKLKAVMPNKKRQLWPGQFVNARLRVGTLENATVVPLAAVQQGPNGAFVYLLGAHNKAQMQPVQVRQQNQTRAVIAQGVHPGQTMITSGFARLTDGAKVSPDNGKDGKRETRSSELD
jgi:multidrug efflux system membrane fusion protein